MIAMPPAAPGSPASVRGTGGIAASTIATQQGPSLPRQHPADLAVGAGLQALDHLETDLGRDEWVVERGLVVLQRVEQVAECE